jgi:hypothetical protein
VFPRVMRDVQRATYRVMVPVCPPSLLAGARTPGTVARLADG